MYIKFLFQIQSSLYVCVRILHTNLYLRVSKPHAMKNINTTLLTFLVIVINYSCSSSDDTVPITDGTPPTVVNPNPNKTTTYTADVKTIIDTHCLECHGSSPSQGAPMSLVTYVNIIDALTNQGRDDLADRMNTTGRNVMPPSGRLPQETIDIVLDWRADGYKE